jgi:peptidoglycan/xylan/chitin deacetylase (PgdA/CDA1 family)
MLNFRNTLITFALVLSVLVLYDLFSALNNWFYPGLLLVLTLILAWGSVSIRSNFYVRSVCSGNPGVREIGLTFDDGPDGLVTPLILDVLYENRIQAAFFIVGSKAEKHPEILRRIDREGHILGGHSFSHHYWFDLFSVRRMKQEMKRTEEVVFQATGRTIRLFRPPYGVTNPAVARVIRDLQYCSVGWSLRSKDTVIKDDEKLLKRLKNRLKPGDVVLMHDNRTWTVNRLKTFIKYLKEQQFAVKRIDKLLNMEAYVD